MQDEADQRHVYIKAGAAVARAIGSGEVAVEVMDRLTVTINRAQASDTPVEDVISMVETDWPDLGAFLRLLVPRSPEAVWAFLTFLVTLWMALRQTGVHISEDDLQRIAQAMADALGGGGADNWPDSKH